MFVAEVFIFAFICLTVLTIVKMSFRHSENLKRIELEYKAKGITAKDDKERIVTEEAYRFQ